MRVVCPTLLALVVVSLNACSGDSFGVATDSRATNLAGNGADISVSAQAADGSQAVEVNSDGTSTQTEGSIGKRYTYNAISSGISTICLDAVVSARLVVVNEFGSEVFTTEQASCSEIELAAGFYQLNVYETE